MASTQKEKSAKKKTGHRTKDVGKNKRRQEQSVKILAGNVGRVDIAQQMIAAGYSVNYARHGQHKHTQSKSFKDLIDQYLPEEELLITHASMKNSRRLDHMVFPTSVEDDVIAELLASTNCILRKVVHGEQAKHAYFWSPDNRARKDALDMAYKIRGMYAPEKVEDVSRNKYSDLPDDELASRRKEAIAFLKKKKVSRDASSG